MTTLTIYKYDIPIEDIVTLSLPKAARILSIQTQNGIPRLWALVDPEEPIRYGRKFLIVGTGHKHPKEYFDNTNYINTFQMMDGALVWHVFELLDWEQQQQTEEGGKE